MINTYYPLLTQKPLVDIAQGREIMEGLLLEQYQGKPNLHEYFMAFFAEMDTLFEQAQEVYLGRFLSYAVGNQLDIIGAILGQNRDVELQKSYFGFSDDGDLGGYDIAGFAHEDTPADGGVFMDENNEGFDKIPLDDVTYRRLLIVKAFCNNRRGIVSSEDVYYIVSVLLEHAPVAMELHTNSSDGAVPERAIDLRISAIDTSFSDLPLIRLAAEYFTPIGTSFTVQRIL